MHRVGNLREAGSLLTRQKIDLAVVAVSPNDSLVYSLNMLQENLPILLIAEVSNQYVSERQRKMAWGIVTYERLTEAFPELDILNEPRDKVEEIFLSQKNQAAPVLNTQKLTRLIGSTLRRYELEMILLTREQELVGLHARGDQNQMIRVGRYVRKNWDAKPSPGQMTWYTDKKAKLQDNQEPVRFLLLTIPYENFLLTMVAGDGGTVLQMRKATRRIVAGMRNSEIEEDDSKPKLNKSLSNSPPNLSSSEFALVWKTNRSLSIEEKFELNRVLPMIGRSFGCNLVPVSIQDDYVQVMSTCPPGRTSAWLVQTYKRQALQHIKKELSIDEDFWLDGYYARPSSSPIESSELSVYLGSPVEPSSVGASAAS
ncbi:MAG: transposase [Anaerolineae bacterium]